MDTHRLEELQEGMERADYERGGLETKLHRAQRER